MATRHGERAGCGFYTPSLDVLLVDITRKADQDAASEVVLIGSMLYLLKLTSYCI